MYKRQPPVSKNIVANSLSLLAEAAAAHREDIDQYQAESAAADSDEENGSQCPIFDMYYNNGGSASIISLTNFAPHVIESIWNVVEEPLVQSLRSGRGKKLKQAPKIVCLCY